MIPYPASDNIIDKIDSRHAVQWNEVEEVFLNDPWFVMETEADQYGEPRYVAFGRTEAGRYLMVVFVPMDRDEAKVITARDMTDSERRRYQQR